MNTIPSREEALFKAALELGTAGERAALLDRECGEDAALRAEVESLLAAMDDAGTKFLGAPAVISASAATILYQRGEGSLPPSSSRSMFSVRSRCHRAATRWAMRSRTAAWARCWRWRTANWAARWR